MPAAAVAVPVLNAHTRKAFVRPAVKEIAATTKILDAVYPYYPKACVCIAGYLSASDQYWKVNYHWDLLMSKIDALLATKTLSAKLRTCAEAIKAALEASAPNPKTGYRSDQWVGQTVDSSSLTQQQARHGVVKQAKKDFEAVIVAAGVVAAGTKSNPPATEKGWWLAVAPVSPPGTSKHGTGYALDIAGDNAETVRISKALGATLAFNEASHVHVEFRNGVTLPG